MSPMSEENQNTNTPPANGGNEQTLLLVLAVVIPPIAVWMASQNNPKQTMRAVVALVLSIFWIPSILYALDIVLDKKIVYPKIDEKI